MFARELQAIRDLYSQASCMWLCKVTALFNVEIWRSGKTRGTGLFLKRKVIIIFKYIYGIP